MPARIAPPPAACTPAQRIYERVVADLTSAVRSIKVGSQQEPGVEMGPLISASQRDRVAGFVDARRVALPHIEITTGGQARAGSGFFYEPTIIAGARQADEIVQREVFGPVVSITRFTDTEEAIALGERLRIRPGLLGLDARYVRRAMQVAARLQYGVHLDQHPLRDRSARCRTAASSAPATARTCRSTPSRTTPCRATSWSSCSSAMAHEPVRRGDSWSPPHY